MQKDVLIAGGGIGGLAAALAARRAGWGVRLFEQAAAFGEVGAGIQLGPNAARVLHSWGLGPALAAVASRPRCIRVQRARDGGLLGRLPLDDFEQRYGAPYATVHRADLHGLLRAAAQAEGVELLLGSRIEGLVIAASAVQLQLADGTVREGDALVAADGLWSALRERVRPGQRPRFTGHLAYRALIEQAVLPTAARSQEVQVWLGPRLHAVAYPVRQGEALNLVVVTEGRVPPDAASWDQLAALADLQPALAGCCTGLRRLVDAMPAWRMWPLHVIDPLGAAAHMAQGPVALLGDAAHPMLPYLAQGAGMAIEDAAALGRVLAMATECAFGVEVALQRYALERWQRCARVQARAQRNGRLFHAAGPLAWGRDLALQVLGRRLLDMPWLYR